MAYSPAQHTPEWYTLKSKTIGGSEIATVIGVNPYSKVSKLIAEKIGLGQKFNGNTATRWGTLFEHVTKSYAELVLQMPHPINEAGSIEGVIKGQRYSPDGIGVVGLLNENNVIDYFIILFEFKAPLNSLPDGKIPKHYRPQVQTGLLSIPITEIAIFVNNSYRKCALRDLNFELTYDKIFHMSDVKKKKTKAQEIVNVYAVGVICFYQTKTDYNTAVNLSGYGTDDSDIDSIDEFDIELNIKTVSEHKAEVISKNKSYSTSDYDMEILVNSKEKALDFGTASAKITDRLFELIGEKRVIPVYCDMILNPTTVNKIPFLALHEKKVTPDATPIKKTIKKQLDKFQHDTENAGHFIIGYLPWKLVKSDVICEEKSEDWLDQIKEPVEETLDIIDKILTAKDREAAYYEAFPDQKPTVLEMDELVDFTDSMKIESDSDLDV